MGAERALGWPDLAPDQEEGGQKQEFCLRHPHQSSQARAGTKYGLSLFGKSHTPQSERGLSPLAPPSWRLCAPRLSSAMTHSPESEKTEYLPW